jgi:hypothetical protein
LDDANRTGAKNQEYSELHFLDYSLFELLNIQLDEVEHLWLSFYTFPICLKFGCCLV